MSSAGFPFWLLIAAAFGVPAGWLIGMIVEHEAGRAIRPWLIGVAVVIAVWAAWVMPSSLLLVAALFLGWSLLALGAVDVLVFRLPDILTYPLAFAGLLLSLWLPDHDPIAHLIGAVAGFLIFWAIAAVFQRLRGREGLGLGDAKLAAAAGAWLGWQALPSVVLIACAIAFVWIGVGMAFRGKDILREQIAFGAPLCAAFWLVWLYGAPL
jgi:leader peptidase (prepilin peptidase)/N-methyltransferase